MATGHQLDLQATNAARAFTLISTRLAPLFELFNVPGTTEVNFNGPGDVWVTRQGRREMAATAEVSEVTAAAAVRELASSMGQEATASTETAIVDAKMPGYRFSAILSPVASKGTAFSIRKHSPRTLSLSDYVEQGSLTPETAELLSRLVKEGRNMLIGGGTDSGKTTFLNALSREIPADERVGTIEDTRELNLIVENWLPLETNAQRGVTPTLCLKALMRQSPDRIICGELRDGAAADFLNSANTGHHGCMATVHCNSAQLALDRLEDLCIGAEEGRPLLSIQRNIGRTIQVVAHFKKSNGRRLLNELVEVHGFNMGTNTYDTTILFNHKEK